MVDKSLRHEDCSTKVKSWDYYPQIPHIPFLIYTLDHEHPPDEVHILCGAKSGTNTENNYQFDRIYESKDPFTSVTWTLI